MILTEQIRKAKKNYQCELCGLKILAGTKYSIHTWVDSDKIHSMKKHIVCDSIALDNWRSSDWEDWDHDFIWFRETYGVTQELVDGGKVVPSETR